MVVSNSACAPPATGVDGAATGFDLEAHTGALDGHADLVLWRPAFFSTKPSLIIKSGMIAADPMGDPNASIPKPQPVHYRTMFAAYSAACAATSMTFLSQNASEANIHQQLGLRSRIGVTKGCRSLSKADMRLNDYQPQIEVDPQSADVDHNRPSADEGHFTLVEELVRQRIKLSTFQALS